MYVGVLCAGAAEYCLRETFNASCSLDEVVMIGRAQYGRMRLGRCIRQNYGHVGCSADVTGFVEAACSGRRHCQLPVKRLIDVAEPCPADVTSHLDVHYTCVPGENRRSRIRILCFFSELKNVTFYTVVLNDVSKSRKKSLANV